MKTRNISWEIVAAGLAFIGIAIFLLNRDSDNSRQWHSERHHIDSIKAPPTPLPPSIVIDLQNLENLKNLRNLKSLENLKNLENLEIELQNLDKLIKDKKKIVVHGESARTPVHQSLENLEKQFQKLEEGNFNIKLQDNKVFINRRFHIDEATWSEVSPGVYIYRKSFDLSNAPDVGLDLAFGNVNIIGTDSTGGEIILQATGDIEDLNMLRKKLQMNMKRAKNNTTFNVSSSNANDISDQVNLEATVKVPERTNFEVTTSGGHISANHLAGDQRFITSGGHITLNDLSGATFAKTSGGHITSDQLDGNSTLTTSGGHIRIDKARGKMDLSTGGGHISIEQLNGQAKAKTSGGNISAGFQTIEGPIDLVTSAGNISLLLPPGINADIDAHGSKISLDKEINFNGTRSERKIKGTINDGGIPISASCEYGNVSIKHHD